MEAAEATIFAAAAQRLRAALRNGAAVCRKRCHEDDVLDDRDPDKAALVVVAEAAVAVLQAAPMGGTAELRAATLAAVRAANKLHMVLDTRLVWLKLMLVPPSSVVVDHGTCHVDTLHTWARVLAEPLMVLCTSTTHVASINGRPVWRNRFCGPASGSGGGSKTFWYGLGGGGGCHSLVSFGQGYLPPRWDRQGFIKSQWAVVWRYLAYFCMFADGPLTDTVNAVSNPRLPCGAVRAALLRGTADPRWATVQEVGNWLLSRRGATPSTPASHVWVLLGAGFKLKKAHGRVIHVRLLAGHKVYNSAAEPLPSPVYEVFPQAPPAKGPGVAERWTPGRAAWCV